MAWKNLWKITLDKNETNSFSSFFTIGNNKAINIYYRHGNPIFEKFYGVGTETFQFLNLRKRINLDFHIDLWDQPSLMLGGEERFNSINTKGGFGGMAKLNFKIKVGDLKNNVHLAGQIGYKTNGYIEGEPLQKGLIFRGGIAYDLLEE
jgi:hypothetical protein